MSTIHQVQGYPSTHELSSRGHEEMMCKEKELKQIDEALHALKQAGAKKIGDLLSTWDHSVDFSSIREYWLEYAALEDKKNMLGAEGAASSDTFSLRKELLLQGIDKLPEVYADLMHKLEFSVFALSKDWQILKSDEEAKNVFIAALKKEEVVFDRFLYCMYVKESKGEFSEEIESSSEVAVRTAEYFSKHVAYLSFVYHLILSKIYAGLMLSQSYFVKVSNVQKRGETLPREFAAQKNVQIWLQIAPLLREISRILSEPDINTSVHTKVRFLCKCHQLSVMLHQIAQDDAQFLELKNMFEFAKSVQPCDIQNASPEAIEDVFKEMFDNDDYNFTVLFTPPVDPYAALLKSKKKKKK